MDSIRHDSGKQDANPAGASAGAPLDSDSAHGPSRTLEFLKSHRSEYISGQDLGDVLGISRVAVWKHVAALRRLGYDIESVQKTGYRLAGIPDEPYPWEVARTGNVVGKKIMYYMTIGSTQDAAAKMGCDAANDGAVIIAAMQTSARGRAGKRWMSPEGGIWMSVVMLQPCAASAASLLPIGAGAAVARAVRDTCMIEPELRWPNDITIRGRKVAGIITEADMELGSIRSMRAGIGVNFDPDIKSVCKSLRGARGFYGATSITAEAQRVGAPRPSKTKLVSQIIANVDDIYRRLLAGDEGSIAAQWSGMPSTIGKRVGATAGGTKITGTAVRISDSGMLVVRRDDRAGAGRMATIMAGSIAHLGG